MTRTILAAASLAMAAFWLARGVGIPVWRDWEPGDAADIALCVFWAVWLLRRREAGQ
jgi:hypothetical protein